MWPELKSFDFVPRTPTRRNPQGQLGDIQKEGRTVLIEYVYEGGAGFASEFQVATLTLRYDQPPQSGLEIRSDDFTIQLADTTGFPPMNPDVKQFVGRDGVACQVYDSLGGDAARGDSVKNGRGVVRPLLKWTTELGQGAD